MKQTSNNNVSVNDILQISDVDELHVDFLVSEVQPRIHFRNACMNTPSVYSCAVDCFLEISYRIFRNCIQNISQDNRSNIFNAIVRTLPVYDVAVSNFNTQLLSEVREPIWDYIVSECSSFAPRNCDAEFSQIFTGSIFGNLSTEEKLLFQTSYSVEGTCLRCNKNNQRNASLIVSYVSEVDLTNVNDFVNDWPQILSPTVNDTKIQCTNCENIFDSNLSSYDAPR